MAYVAAFDVDECCQCVMVWNEPISMLPKQLNTITTCHDLRMMERYQPIDYVGVGDVCLDVKFFVPLPHFPIFHVWPDCQAIFSSVLRHHAILCDSVSLFISCECVYACQRRCRQLHSFFFLYQTFALAQSQSQMEHTIAHHDARSSANYLTGSVFICYNNNNNKQFKER